MELSIPSCIALHRQFRSHVVSALSTPHSLFTHTLIHSTFCFVIVEIILLPYLLVIPLSFVNTFDINDNYSPNLSTDSMIDLFFLFATPFCSRLYGMVRSLLIPISWETIPSGHYNLCFFNHITNRFQLLLDLS